MTRKYFQVWFVKKLKMWKGELYFDDKLTHTVLRKSRQKCDGVLWKISQECLLDNGIILPCRDLIEEYLK